MARDDEAGAVAAAEYFLTRLYPYTVSSQDTSAWREMSHADCVFCASTIETAAKSGRDGRAVKFSTFGATDRSFETVGPAAFGVFMRLQIGPTTTYDPGGAVVGGSPATSGRASVAMVREGTRWKVLGVELHQDAIHPR